MSYHHLPPSVWSPASEHLLSRVDGAFGAGLRVFAGASWTADALNRESDPAVAAPRAYGLLAVK